MSRWLCSIASVLVLLAVAPSAHAQGDPPQVVQAREHLARGTQFLDQENYDAALAEFERAYELVGSHPSRHLILFNIARAHERRFRYDLALTYYGRYLEEAPADAPERGEVQGIMRALEGFLATVHVESNVPAEVWADNRRVGDAPGALRLPGGRHVLELRAAGYADARQEIQITARETRSLEITLSALAAEYRGVSPAFFWGSAAIAAVALLAGGGVGVAALVQRGDVDAQRADPVDMRDGAALLAARSDIASLQLTADVLFGTAALFAVGAAVLAFLTDWGSAEDATTRALRAAPFVGPDSAGLALGGAL